jgi:peptidoglycan DL-endopeptidase CwlO
MPVNGVGEESRLRRARATRRHTTRCSIPGLIAGAAGLAVCSAILPGATATAAPASGNPTSLNAVLAEANRLSQQIDVLGQQYDGLKVQLGEAHEQAALALQEAAVENRLLGKDEKAISAIAAEGYMSGGYSPVLQLLQSANPQTLLNRASIMSQLAQENDAKVSLVVNAARAAQRAKGAAAQEEQKAGQLSKAIAAKVALIQKKENFFNGEAFKKAEQIFEKTGHYPKHMHVAGDSIGVQALNWALAEIGHPYVWGGAGPVGFDCSGLVVWAYEHVGIYLTHFTGAQWNEVKHIPISELKPGDLLFFFADISHVGMYVGNGLMVDAPTFGQDVQIQPIFYSALVGAGEVIG